MKLKHCLIIKAAIEKWLSKNPKPVFKSITKDIVCLATRFNWEVFMVAKVEGNTIRFIARELGYLTSEQIAKALMKITQIDGSGIHGSGVQR